MSDQEVQNAYRVLERHGENVLFIDIKISGAEIIYTRPEIVTYDWKRISYPGHLSIFLPEVKLCSFCEDKTEILLYFKDRIIKFKSPEKDAYPKLLQQWKMAKLLTCGRK